jgi:DNA-binding CsgD family transcriptional regulator
VVAGVGPGGMTVRTPARQGPAARATARELDVVEAVLLTGSEKAAAHRLRLAHSTVKHHLANALSKVGAETTTQLVWILAPRLRQPDDVAPLARRVSPTSVAPPGRIDAVPAQAHASRIVPAQGGVDRPRRPLGFVVANTHRRNELANRRRVPVGEALLRPAAGSHEQPVDLGAAQREQDVGRLVERWR